MNLITETSYVKYSKLSSIKKAVHEIDKDIKLKDIKLALRNLGYEAQTVKLTDKNTKKTNSFKNVYALKVNNDFDFIKERHTNQDIKIKANVFDFDLTAYDDEKAAYYLHLVNIQTGEVFDVFCPSIKYSSFNLLHDLGHEILGIEATLRAYKKGVSYYTLKNIVDIEDNEYSLELRRDYKYTADSTYLVEIQENKLLTVSELENIQFEIENLKVVNGLTIVSKGLCLYLRNKASNLNINFSCAKDKNLIGLPATFFEDFYEFFTESALPQLMYYRSQVKSDLKTLEDLECFKVLSNNELTESAKKLVSEAFAINRDTASILENYIALKNKANKEAVAAR